MEPFEYYLKAKLARKVSPNQWRAKSLINDIVLREKFLKQIKIKEFSKIFFEQLYDIIRDFCDAILFIDGYKSYSHDASISYLSKKGFDFISVNKLDFFRYKRNRSKYYGEPITESDAQDLNEFYLNIKIRLNNAIKGLK